jgi:hypothetical protein
MMSYGGKLMAVTVIVFWAVLAVNQASAQKVTRDESLRRGEKRTTLEPSLFKDERVKKAYQAAKEIPWVLDSIYCYCQCEESPAFRHRSLLSCYVDKHAAM